MTSWRVIESDCVEAMAAMDEASVDAVVCDPPYGIGFMGKEWDGRAIAEAAQRDRDTRTSLGPASPSRPGRTEPRSSSAFGNEAILAGPVRGGRDFQAWCEAWAHEALRVLKPGGHLLAFGGTRTYHRLACAIEDAGFEIRDTICWLYGSGFPKSLDVSKAIDKAAGAARKVVGIDRRYNEPSGIVAAGRDERVLIDREITVPATPAAERWQGWGTALKPAHEPIVVARKPLAGTVAANVLEHGTGALNVDGCRIGTEGGGGNGLGSHFDRLGNTEPLVRHGEDAGGSTGRWPANVVLDEQAATMLDEQTGDALHLAGNKGGTPRDLRNYSAGERGQTNRVDAMPASPMDESAGASRFFYVAKASSAERNAGLDGFEAKGQTDDGYGSIQTPKLDRATPRENWTPHPVRNVHPTVKPIALMRWLVRLVTPPGGLVLDPFAGSGTTGCAATLEGFDFIGIEREAEYAEIARARIAWWAEHPEGVELVDRLDAEQTRRAVADAGQLQMFGKVA